jgi:hypothetical protein
LHGPKAIVGVNYNPILSSEREPHIKKPAVSCNLTSTSTKSVMTQCGGELQYLHCPLASNKGLQKGNPVPGGYKYWDLALHVDGVSN